MQQARLLQVRLSLHVNPVEKKSLGKLIPSRKTLEGNALHYFWWFMLLSAFTGTSFSTAAINGFTQGLNLASELQKVIETTAATIPKQVSASWLNVSDYGGYITSQAFLVPNVLIPSG